MTVNPSTGTAPSPARRVRALALLICILCALASTLVLSGCGAQGASGQEPAESSEATASSEPSNPTEVKVISMTGPTSIGLLDLMERAEAGETADTYDFSIVGTADEVVAKVVSGDVDVALVPANVASVLWNKTEGAVSVIDINTLSVLNVVTGDAAIASFDDLQGHTVYLTGKGSTPEYVTQYLIEEKGLSDVSLEFKSEATEVGTLLASDPSAVAILPQPYVSAVTTQNPDLKAVCNLGDVWREVAPAGSELVTGVTIVRSDFADEHPDAVTRFVEGQDASVQAVLADPAAFAQMVVDKGIIQSAAVAEKAIGQCSLVCITGEDMEKALEGYLGVLHGFDPASVGGSLPDSSFYRLDV